MKAERPFPVELWEQIPAAVQDYIHALEARVTALEAGVQRLEATVQHLTERLRQDSRTQWTAARRAARPRGAGTGDGAS